MEDRINPYNNKNIDITEADINILLETHQVYYKIKNIDLFRRSFVHRSYMIQNDIKQVQKPYDCIELKQSSNERLEFLGDGILESITKLYLYKRFPDADEGFMTEKKNMSC